MARYLIQFVVVIIIIIIIVFYRSESLEVMDGHKSRVFSACFRPKSAHELISGGWDNTIQFWDSRQPYALKRISGVHMCGDGLDISKNGKEVIRTLVYSRILTRSIFLLLPFLLPNKSQINLAKYFFTDRRFE